MIYGLFQNVFYVDEPDPHICVHIKAKRMHICEWVVSSVFDMCNFIIAYLSSTEYFPPLESTTLDDDFAGSDYVSCIVFII